MQIPLIFRDRKLVVVYTGKLRMTVGIIMIGVKYVKTPKSSIKGRRNVLIIGRRKFTKYHEAFDSRTHPLNMNRI